jgi:hypothetical protein
VRFQVLTMMSIKITAFWDIALCSLVETDWHGSASQKTVIFNLKEIFKIRH